MLDREGIRQATVNQDDGCTVTKLRVPQPVPVDRRDAAGLGLGQCRRRGQTHPGILRASARREHECGEHREQNQRAAYWRRAVTRRASGSQTESTAFVPGN